MLTVYAADMREFPIFLQRILENVCYKNYFMNLW